MTAEFTVAVHALVFLYHKGTAFNSEAIATNVCTNPARIRKVLAKLKAAKLVETKGGAEGGYTFAGDGSMTLADVYSAVGAHAAKTEWRSGNPCLDCPIASGMAPLMDTIFNELDDACRATLQRTTIAALEAQLCKKGASHEV